MNDPARYAWLLALVVLLACRTTDAPPEPRAEAATPAAEAAQTLVLGEAPLRIAIAPPPLAHFTVMRAGEFEVSAEALPASASLQVVHPHGFVVASATGAEAGARLVEFFEVGRYAIRLRGSPDERVEARVRVRRLPELEAEGELSLDEPWSLERAAPFAPGRRAWVELEFSPPRAGVYTFTLEGGEGESRTLAVHARGRRFAHPADAGRSLTLDLPTGDFRIRVVGGPGVNGAALLRVASAEPAAVPVRVVLPAENDATLVHDVPGDELAIDGPAVALASAPHPRLSFEIETAGEYAFEMRSSRSLRGSRVLVRREGGGPDEEWRGAATSPGALSGEDAFARWVLALSPGSYHGVVELAEDLAGVVSLRALALPPRPAAGTIEVGGEARFALSGAGWWRGRARSFRLTVPGPGPHTFDLASDGRAPEPGARVPDGEIQVLRDGLPLNDPAAHEGVPQTDGAGRARLALDLEGGEYEVRVWAAHPSSPAPRAFRLRVHAGDPGPLAALGLAAPLPERTIPEQLPIEREIAPPSSTRASLRSSSVLLALPGSAVTTFRLERSGEYEVFASLAPRDGQLVLDGPGGAEWRGEPYYGDSRVRGVLPAGVVRARVIGHEGHPTIARLRVRALATEERRARPGLRARLLVAGATALRLPVDEAGEYRIVAESEGEVALWVDERGVPRVPDHLVSRGRQDRFVGALSRGEHVLRLLERSGHPADVRLRVERLVPPRAERIELGETLRVRTRDGDDWRASATTLAFELPRADEVRFVVQGEDGSCPAIEVRQPIEARQGGRLARVVAAVGREAAACRLDFSLPLAPGAYRVRVWDQGTEVPRRPRPGYRYPIGEHAFWLRLEGTAEPARSRR